MRNIGIGTRIVLSFCMVLILAMSMVSVYYVGNSIAGKNLELSREYAKLEQILANLERNFLVSGENAALYAATGSREYYDAAVLGAKSCAQLIEDAAVCAGSSETLSEYEAPVAELRSGLSAWSGALESAGRLDGSVQSAREKTLAGIVGLNDALNKKLDGETAKISAIFKTTMTVSICLTALAVVLGYTMARMVRRSITVPLSRISEAAAKISTGDMNVRVDTAGNDEITRMSKIFNTMSSGIREQERILAAVAEGDLSVTYTPRSEADSMGKSLVVLIDQLSDIVARITDTAESVSSGADQVAGSSQSLAQGTTEQAAAIEQLSSSIFQIAGQARENAEKAGRAQQETVEISAQTETGRRQMNAMVAAVAEISQASKTISKVIKTIDDIAFQTNILALNAAVEAARAGQHGKGFAVVAEEVRSLASKSAQAASETTGIIETSVRKTEEGAQIARDTSRSLESIMEGIGRTASLVSEIASATQESSLAIAQINSGIDQVGQVVQSNSATSEESSAAADALSSQAGMLSSLISRFHIGRALPGYGESETPMLTEG